jgi:O-antigen/teichoic acid export membrane protein
MYRAGHTSINDSLNVVRRYAGAVVVYSILAGVILVAISRFLPEIIGEDFSEMAVMTLALAGMPLLQSSHRILGAVLMTSGEVHWKGAAQVLTASLNIVLSLILIAQFSWQGAVVSSYASELILLAIFVAVLRRRRRFEAEVHPERSAAAR